VGTAKDQHLGRTQLLAALSPEKQQCEVGIAQVGCRKAKSNCGAAFTALNLTTKYLILVNGRARARSNARHADLKIYWVS
jgi:hypothetical protein